MVLTLLGVVGRSPVGFSGQIQLTVAPWATVSLYLMPFEGPSATASGVGRGLADLVQPCHPWCTPGRTPPYNLPYTCCTSLRTDLRTDPTGADTDRTPTAVLPVVQTSGRTPFVQI